MSYQTTADHHRDSAIDHVRAALEDLHEILVRKCSGHDEYRREYYVQLCVAQTRLMNILQELGGTQ